MKKSPLFRYTIYEVSPLYWSLPADAAQTGAEPANGCDPGKEKDFPTLSGPVFQWSTGYQRPQHFLYFLPLPQGQGSFLPIFFPFTMV